MLRTAHKATDRLVDRRRPLCGPLATFNLAGWRGRGALPCASTPLAGAYLTIARLGQR
uniref:Uncharacterized protein n=1 Tax=Rhizobium rhizogenes TaxID=359 RepID=A0A7S4ZSR5_RHIRH|nr:hypothetical protein pC5.8b_386 [Rhizobium rhizogenes]